MAIEIKTLTLDIEKQEGKASATEISYTMLCTEHTLIRKTMKNVIKINAINPHIARTEETNEHREIRNKKKRPAQFCHSITQNDTVKRATATAAAQINNEQKMCNIYIFLRINFYFIIYMK